MQLYVTTNTEDNVLFILLPMQTVIVFCLFLNSTDKLKTTYFITLKRVTCAFYFAVSLHYTYIRIYLSHLLTLLNQIIRCLCSISPLFAGWRTNKGQHCPVQYSFFAENVAEILK